MSKIFDDEFGEITIRRSSLSSSVKISVAPNGTLRISMPKYTPLVFAKRFVASSRTKIRELTAAQQTIMTYEHGMQVGKSHHLQVRDALTIKSHLDGLLIVLTKPVDVAMSDPHVQQELREIVIKALRIEAKSYLPRRLSYLADKNGFDYQKVRFSHASSRWGSCSSNRTISLNIALMKLDFELIDYVLIHELAHTKEMNHSDKFWRIVASIDPSFKLNRNTLKNESPSI